MWKSFSKAFTRNQCPRYTNHFNPNSLKRTYGHPFHISRSPFRPFSLTCRRAAFEHDRLPNPPQLTLSDAQRKTIYALSTPPGKAGVAVVRISGPDALLVWHSMVKRGKGKATAKPKPWKMERCEIVHPKSGELIDDGLVVFFRGPHSFTTEDTIELHTHSGRALISALLSALSALPSLRPAEPGEFTRRAFLAGRLDLTQVEGLKDLIDAETEGQRKSALRAAGGDVRATLDELRTGIIHCLAMVEALIDFGEGEEIEEGVYEQARAEAKIVLRTIETYLTDARRGEIIRAGIRLAIFGPPNAGKSSLLNFLAQRPASIVTPIPGTTRDILELSLDLAGLPVIVADTAGLRETQDVVESIGVGRARQAVQNADIRLCVLSLPEILPPSADFGFLQLNIPDTVKDLITPDTYFLFNKSDLLTPSESGQDSPSSQILLKTAQSQGAGAWIASLTTASGTQEFLDGFGKALKAHFELDDTSISSAQAPIITRERHRVHLESAAQFLHAFLETPASDVVLGAEELRYAAQAVGKVSGLIDVEDILDAVFRDFCIGK